MKALKPALLALALALTHTAQAQGPQDAGALMRHGNPSMPNLMQVVKKHGQMLELSEAQAAAMKAWRAENGPKINALLEQLQALEAQILRASLDD